MTDRESDLLQHLRVMPVHHQDNLLELARLLSDNTPSTSLKNVFALSDPQRKFPVVRRRAPAIAAAVAAASSTEK